MEKDGFRWWKARLKNALSRFDIVRIDHFRGIRIFVRSLHAHFLFRYGLTKSIEFFPGTYGTSLVRNHSLNGVFSEMSKIEFPAEVVEGIKDSIDCNLYFFGNKVEIWQTYLILLFADLLLISVYILINVLRTNRKKG